MNLNVKKIGDSEQTMFILHGLFGMLDNWTTLGKKFSQDRTVYLLDLRNHGKSPHSEVMTYRAMCTDIIEFMELNQIEKAHILGHSMGGKVAMMFAELYPDLVSSLMLIDIAPKKYKPGHLEIIDALESLPIRSISSRKEAEEWMQERIKNKGVQMFLLKNLQRSQVGFSWKMNLKGIVDAYYEIIGKVELKTVFPAPTLIIKGGDSNYINSDDLSGMKSIYVNAEFCEIENAGHWVHAEQPGAFYTAVNRFLLEM